MAASRFTHDLFKYLAEPEPNQQPQPDESITPYAGGLIISDGQVIGLNYDLYWPLGTGPGQIHWAGSGGFAAYGRDRIVQLGRTMTALTWGKTRHFVGASDVLVFGADDADATLIWDTKLDLGSGERTIRLIKGLEEHYRAVVRFDQGFANGDLVFEGNGRADLSAANDDWQGNLTVRGADVRANLDASLHGLHSITIEHGGRFIVDNFGTSSELWGGRYLENRLSQFTVLNLNSGTLAYWGRDSGNSAEHTGPIELLGGANVIDINSGTGQTSILTIGGLHRSTGATLNLVSSNSFASGLGTGGNTPQLKFRDQAGPWDIPSLEGSILPWATVNGSDFATLKGKHLVAFTDYYTGDASTWQPNHNVSLTSYQVLTADRTINSLRLTGGYSLALASNTKLTLNAGALLSTGKQPNEIHGGELVTQEREFFAHVFQGSLSITSDIRQTFPSNAQGIGLVKTGDGTLFLYGKDLSALRGNHYINEGTLHLGREGDGVGLSGHIIVGNSRGDDTTLQLYQGSPLERATSITLRGKRIRDGTPPSHHLTRLALYSVQQYLDTLTVEGAGVLGFRGSRNIIGFDHIRMADSTSELRIAGWDALTQHLLIRRNAGDEVSKYLGQIKFVEKSGSESSAHLIDYNSDYWEIVPTWFNGVPEPSTTGALVGAGALGFFAWRRRRRRNK